jgi:proteasome lid subunit RPN8/RPN11
MFEDCNNSVFVTNNEWTSDIKVHEKCILGEGKIIMDSFVYDRIRVLLFGVRTEWLGYLIGELIGNVATITDIYIPQQEVSSVSVKVKDDVLPNNIVGTVHSHHSMGSFFSGTDRDFLVGNHAVTVVVSYERVTSKMRVLAPCGAYMLLDAEVEVRDSSELANFLRDSALKMKGAGVLGEITQEVGWLYKWIKKSIQGIRQYMSDRRESHVDKETPIV